MIQRNLSTLTSTAAYAVRHPARSALRAVGVAKGLTSAGASLAGSLLSGGDQPQAGQPAPPPQSRGTVIPPQPDVPPVPTPSPDPSPAPRPVPSPGPIRPDEPMPTPVPGPQRVLAEPGARLAAEAAEHLPTPPVATPGEAFATEPTATTRDSAHGGASHDEEIDEWEAEAAAEIEEEQRLS